MTTSTQTQLRRGTSTQCDAMTPVVGEVVVDTTKSRGRLGDGAKVGGWHLPNHADIQYNNMIGSDAGGTADAITVTLAPTPAAWTKYMSGLFMALGANTVTNPTFGITGVTGTKTIKKKSAAGKAALAVGDIQTNVVYRWVYDGTDILIESVDIAPTSDYALIKTLTASASSSLDFTSVITSAFAIYDFEIDDLKVSVDASDLWLRTSSDNSTFDAAAGNYAYTIQSGQAIGTTAGSAASSSDTKIQLNSSRNIGNAAAEGISGRVTLRSPLGTARAKYLDSNLFYEDPSTNKINVGGFGMRLSTSAVNALRFLPSTGNFVSGKIRAYGRKA